MKTIKTISLIMVVALCLHLSNPMNAFAQRQPNIVLIMADDISWECFGCYGSEEYSTSRLDALAIQGIKFNHCYSTPICTTSRVKLMTGKYNFRNYTHFGYLNPKEKTFGNLLKSAGYKTAIAGKWQLNGLRNALPGHKDSTRPHKAGFDEYMLWQLTKPKSAGERFWSPTLEHNGKLLTKESNEGKYGPDLLCDFVCEFIDRNQKSPFFVYYPMVLVHDPFVPTPDTIGKRSRGHEANGVKNLSRKEKKENFVAMVKYMDKLVGRVVDQLEKCDQLENTIVIFTADNGTHRSIKSQWNGLEIQGGKATMKDMGTHVPMIAFWKDHTPSGKESDALIDFTDVYPTFAEAAGVNLKEDDPQDGVSFYSSLVGKDGPRRDWLLCHYQPYWNKVPGQFVRTQNYKLYRDGRFFDIGSGDLDEAKDLSGASLSQTGAALMKLQKLIEKAPPAPKGKGNADTVKRPTWQDWPILDSRQQ